MPNYTVFGLRLSVPQPVPELLSVATDLCSSPSKVENVDVVVDFDRDWQEAIHRSPLREVVYVSPEQIEPDKPILQVWLVGEDGFRHLSYSDGVDFVVEKEGQRIGVTWSNQTTFADALPYFLGPVLGLVLRLRGQTPLHASAIAVDDLAVLLVGPMGAGKSSTAAAFAQLGFPVLSDDVTVLVDKTDDFSVQPGYPGLRLWPDMVETLFGEGAVLPQIIPAWEKRRLDLIAAGYRFSQTDHPIGAIYLLNERSADKSAPYIAPLSKQEALLRLIANGYVHYLLDRSMRAQEFDVLSRVVQNVPLRQVTPHADPTRLSDLCRVILDDVSHSARRQPEAHQYTQRQRLALFESGEVRLAVPHH